MIFFTDRRSAAYEGINGTNCDVILIGNFTQLFIERCIINNIENWEGVFNTSHWEGKKSKYISINIKSENIKSVQHSKYNVHFVCCALFFIFFFTSQFVPLTKCWHLKRLFPYLFLYFIYLFIYYIYFTSLRKSFHAARPAY